jgi:hypothetical protein
MVQSVLHNVHSSTYFIDKGQMKNCGANKTSNHHWNSHWVKDNIGVNAITEEFFDCHKHKHKLENESKK